MISQSSQRLMGAVVLIALAVGVWLSFFNKPARPLVDRETHIPQPPAFIEYAVLEPYRPVGIEPATIVLKAELNDQVIEPLESIEPSPATNLPATDPVAAVATWTIQVGSFQQANNAQNIIDALQAEGYSVYQQTIDQPTGTLIRVYVGPFVDRSVAQQTRAAIDHVFAVQASVVSFDPALLTSLLRSPDLL